MNRLLQLIDSLCLITDDSLTLSGGSISNFYFDCKKATLHGECLDLIAEAFLREIEIIGIQPTAIGGLTMGADFITSAVILKAYQQQKPALLGSIVRKEPKQQGTKTLIENQLPPGTRIVVVDDVITTGSSIRQAAETFQVAGYEIVGIIALIDRKEAWGVENLVKQFACPVSAIFRKYDFPRLL